MAAATALSTTTLLFTTPPKPFPIPPNQHTVSFNIKLTGRTLRVHRPIKSTPTEIVTKVVESIEKAKETCSENVDSGECAAAWDEVEELSAAVSHAKAKAKSNEDPLEAYCKDNPETNECRIYDD